MKRRWHYLFFLVGLLLVPTIVLWNVDGANLGDSTSARVILNCIMVFISLPIAKAHLGIPKRPILFSIATTIGLALAGFIFFHPVASGITGRLFSNFEKVEVLFIGPLAEELYFRGMIWSFVDRHFSAAKGRCPLMGTSFAFGLYHIGFWSQGLTIFALQHIAGVTAAGLVFGYIRLKSKGLAWPVVAHGYANAVILLARIV